MSKLSDFMGGTVGRRIKSDPSKRVLVDTSGSVVFDDDGILHFVVALGAGGGAISNSSNPPSTLVGGDTVITLPKGSITLQGGHLGNISSRFNDTVFTPKGIVDEGLKDFNVVTVDGMRSDESAEDPNYKSAGFPFQNYFREPGIGSQGVEGSIEGLKGRYGGGGGFYYISGGVGKYGSAGDWGRAGQSRGKSNYGGGGGAILMSFDYPIKAGDEVVFIIGAGGENSVPIRTKGGDGVVIYEFHKFSDL